MVRVGGANVAAETGGTLSRLIVSSSPEEEGEDSEVGVSEKDKEASLEREGDLEPSGRRYTWAAGDKLEEGGARDQDRRVDEAGGRPAATKEADLESEGPSEGKDTSEESTGRTGHTRQEGASDPLLLLIPLSENGDPVVWSEMISSTRLQTRLLDVFARTSKVIQQTALESIKQCRRNQLDTACQQWSNLCSLSLYAHSDVPTSNGASSLPGAPSYASSSPGAESNSARLKQSLGRLVTGKRFSESLRRKQQQSERRDRRKNDKLALVSGKSTSWQKCAQFSLTSICNSLIDWHRLEKAANNEIANIYLDSYASGSSGGGGSSSGGASTGISGNNNNNNNNYEDNNGSNLDGGKRDDGNNYVYSDSGEEGNNNLADIDDATNIGSPELRPRQSQRITLKLNQLIQLIAYKYSFEGKLMQVSQFDLFDMSLFSCATIKTHLQLQKTSTRSTSDQIKVGQNYINRCQVDLLKLDNFLNQPSGLNETQFYDLFIGYSSNRATFIKPVPILIRNLLYNGQLVNVKYQRDPTRWKLVRRFFFHSVDRVTLGLGQTRMPGEQQEAEQEAQLFTFVRSANLDLKFKKHQERGGFLLTSIALHLDYGQYLARDNWRQSLSNASTQIPPHEWTNIEGVQVAITQNLVDMSSSKKDLDLFMTIPCILSSLWSMVKCYNIQKYQGLIRLDIYSLILFLLISCDTVGNLLLLINLLFALYLFALFKFNTLFNPANNDWQLFAPSTTLEQAVIFNLKMAFIFKSIGFAYKLYVNLNVDLFFIDWERPKMLTSSQILQHYHPQTNSNKTSSKHNSAGQQNQQHRQETSIWRPYTIINRWIQLSTLRRCNLSVQLILLLCLMESNSIFMTNQLSSLSPMKSIANHSPRETIAQLELGQSCIFRALILSLVYMSLAMGQYLFKRLVYEPMFRSVIGEFVDLCSVANVSLFAMLYPRYGFYLHGRNANGSADSSLLEMNALLERERDGLCAKRGLAPDSDQQTFVMLLPKIINDHYRKLLFTYSLSNLAESGPGGKLIATNNGRPLMGAPPPRDGGLIKFAMSFSQAQSANQFPSNQLNNTLPKNRAFIETLVARNKAINTFLMNFLDHIYKDIDYTIREPRRFDSFLLEGDNESSFFAKPDSLSFSTGGPLMVAGNALLEGQRMQTPTATTPPQPSTATTSEYRATFCLDRSATSFTRLLLYGIELDVIVCELLCLLILDHLLGASSLLLTVSLIWLASGLFSQLYLSLTKRNLAKKSMLDEKFLIR